MSCQSWLSNSFKESLKARFFFFSDGQQDRFTTDKNKNFVTRYYQNGGLLSKIYNKGKRFKGKKSENGPKNVL